MYRLQAVDIPILRLIGFTILCLMVVLLVGALGLTGWRPDRPLALVGVGLLLSGAADIIYLSAIAGGQADSPAWTYWLWPASALVTAIGAWQRPAAARAVRL